MTLYRGEENYRHGEAEPLGVLLVNLGTPDAPTRPALKRYLKEFLSDPRVVDLPRALWLPILHGVILQVRPGRSAKNYQKVWSDEGSPLLAISKKQQAGLQQLLDTQLARPLKVELAMRYGNPSVEAGMKALQAANVRQILVLPLYPQYAAATTGSVFDAVAQVAQGMRWIPELRFINQYFDQQGYIDALAESVHEQWREHGRGDKLVLSFHGIPKRMHLDGDPYYCHCQATARLLAEKLELDRDQWQLVFQSRFGREEWLQPYAGPTLEEMAKSGVKKVDVICPGFSADCLETLEEIGEEYRELFIASGGEALNYIPALNERDAHLAFLSQLLLTHLSGWGGVNEWDAEQDQRRLDNARERATALGAKA